MKKITKIAVRHWKFILAWNQIILGLAVTNIAFLPRIWNSKAQLLLPNLTSNLDPNSDDSDILKDEGLVSSQPANIISSIATSDNVVRKVWEKDPQKTSYKKISEYKGLFDVSPENDSTVISITAQASNPRLARERAQNLITSFKERLQELRQDEVISESELIQEEVRQARQKLIDAQKNLHKFKEAGNLASYEHNLEQTITTINALNKSRVEALADAKAAQTQTSILSERLSVSPENVLQPLDVKDKKQSQSIRDRLSKIDISLKEAQNKLNSDRPQIQNLKFQKKQLHSQLKDNISDASSNLKQVNPNITGKNTHIAEQMILAESRAKAMSSKAEQLKVQINYLREELKKLPAKQSILLDLQRRYDTTQKAYDALVTQAQQIKLSAFDAYPRVQLLDEPFVINQPSSPNIGLIIVGALLVSIFGSTAIVFFLV